MTKELLAQNKSQFGSRIKSHQQHQRMRRLCIRTGAKDTHPFLFCCSLLSVLFGFVIHFGYFSFLRNAICMELTLAHEILSSEYFPWYHKLWPFISVQVYYAMQNRTLFHSIYSIHAGWPASQLRNEYIYRLCRCLLVVLADFPVVILFVRLCRNLFYCHEPFFHSGELNNATGKSAFWSKPPRKSNNVFGISKSDACFPIRCSFE